MSITEYSFTVKTPVHIGSGERLGKMDFLLERNQCLIIDLDMVLFELKDNSSALDEFGGEKFNINDFLKKYKISPSKVKKYSLRNPENVKPFNIQEMLKTGMGNALLPGTSIKGAIRTVILWHLFKDTDKGKAADILNKVLKSKVKKEQADNELDHFLFGSDPNHDFLRGLQVGDVEFKLSDLKLLECKVLSFKEYNSFGWKRMGRGGFNTPNPRQATSVYCESLALNAVSIGRIKFEEFLFENTLSIKELRFSDKKELLDILPQKCNKFTESFIVSEIDFFESCKMKEMVEFYGTLREEIPRDGESFYLHLGWGSGWRGMTGNYLSGDNLEALRKKFNMGKQNFLIFPKTRKIAFENGKPKYPLGWIKIEKIKEDVIHKEQSVDIITSKPVPASQTEFMKIFEDFRLSPSPENFRKFIEKIKPEEIEDLKVLSFENMRDSINIGFVTPLAESDIHAEIKKVLAGKLLEVIEKGKKWKRDKLAKYEKLQTIAGEN